VLTKRSTSLAGPSGLTRPQHTARPSKHKRTYNFLNRMSDYGYPIMASWQTQEWRGACVLACPAALCHRQARTQRRTLYNQVCLGSPVVLSPCTGTAKVTIRLTAYAAVLTALDTACGAGDQGMHRRPSLYAWDKPWPILQGLSAACGSRVGRPALPSSSHGHSHCTAVVFSGKLPYGFTS
jgi:hypothetical protein